MKTKTYKVRTINLSKEEIKQAIIEYIKKNSPEAFKEGGCKCIFYPTYESVKVKIKTGDFE